MLFNYHPIFAERLVSALAIISVAICLSLVTSFSIAQTSASCSPTSPTGGTCGGEGPATQGNQSNQDQGAGNPINIISGNKYQRELDLPSLPGVLGLEVVRHYNSQAVDFTGHVGRGWRLSYETEVRRSGNRLQLFQADGTVLQFVCGADTCKSGRWADGFIRIGTQGYAWQWASSTEAGRVLKFDNNGLLLSIRTAAGFELTITREKSGRIHEVVDPQGRKLAFHYPSAQDLSRNPSRFNGVSAIDTPVGRIQYTHGSSLTVGLSAAQRAAVVTVGDKSLSTAYVTRQSNLIGASLLSGAQRVYHYESIYPGQASFLTGISVQPFGKAGTSVEFGSPEVRQSTYLYDEAGMAVLSTKGAPARLADTGGLAATGIEQVRLIRSVQGQTLLLNSLGHYTLYKHAMIAGQLRILEAIGSGCAQCGEVNKRYRFDRAGNLIEAISLSPTLVTVKANGDTVLNKKPSEVNSLFSERDPLGRVSRVWHKTAEAAKQLLQTVAYLDKQIGRAHV